MTKSSRIYFSFVQAIQVIKKTRSALIRALLVLLFMQTKGKWFLSLDLPRLTAAAVLMALALSGLILALQRIWTRDK